ncbi:MAG TPA: nicotinate (nicotinamide) nucleotide adenylyltransferase [Chitinophagales bacterium]|nr:nicotinate (nicotinamide) nucleotide adenylyltransferase [Chitinophagales bacterium]
MHKKIGLFFGSFNPIHVGHLLLATHLREAANLDEIWFIVSPQNPFKQNSELADEQHRLEMVKLATKNVDYFNVSDLEFHLEKPSYTHLTLKELSKQFPEYTFHLIIGEDNVIKFHEWKEAEWILDNYKVVVYNRTIPSEKTTYDARLTTHDFPLFDISSTVIRKRIKENKPVHYFVTENVEHYIRFHKLYL